ncbi:MAG TPA: DUF5666 domain-containing protein [Terracidiphilus sp.]|nr:DUF5666 domain-containing protein [Terracidiphilus sp.]
MRVRIFLAVLLAVALGATAGAQDQNSPPDQNSAPQAGQYGGGYGRRGGGRGFGGMGMMGRAISGNVTDIAAGRFTVKTFEGDTYTVNFSDSTRFMKMQGGMGGGRGRMGGGGMRGNPPEPIKAADIKVGDPIAARGQVDASAKTIGAAGIMLLDPQAAQRMQQMAADYGKTWFMGRVTTIDGTNVTLTGTQDNAPHTFAVNENTDFRERRTPITLADVKVGDMIRAQGALSNGTFIASIVNVMRMPQGGPNGPGNPASSPNQ